MLTYVDFWRKDGGNKSRIAKLVKYLSKRTRLTVVYVGWQKEEDKAILEKEKMACELVFLGDDRELTNFEYIQRFRAYIAGKDVDILLVEYIHLAIILDYVPKHIKLILDTHDLMSEREKSFKNFGYEHPRLSWENELEIFRRFDAVMLIQEDEYLKIREVLGNDRTILVPHAVSLPKQQLRPKVSNIGFVGNVYPANEDGLRWFIRSVWPLMDKREISLNVYGKIQRVFADSGPYEKVRFHGFVPNLNDIFSEVDVMVNPVRMGAGLKIKNIESMGSGIPLVTTSHSASGLKGASGEAFLVADDAESFADCLRSLMADFKRRRKLGDTAYDYIRESFSEERCYGPLMECINQLTISN